MIICKWRGRPAIAKGHHRKDPSLGLGVRFFMGRLGSGTASWVVQQLGLLPVMVIEFGAAVYRIA